MHQEFGWHTAYNFLFLTKAFFDKSFSILFPGTPLNMTNGGSFSPIALHAKITDILSFSYPAV